MFHCDYDLLTPSQTNNANFQSLFKFMSSTLPGKDLLRESNDFVLVHDGLVHDGTFCIRPSIILREVLDSMPSKEKLDVQFEKDTKRSHITINDNPITTSAACRHHFQNYDSKICDDVVGLLTQAVLADVFLNVHSETFETMSKLGCVIVSGNTRSDICFDVTIVDTEIVINSNVKFMMKNEKSEVVGHIDVRYEIMFDDGDPDEFSNVTYEIMCA
jgi:hypothetical protein